MNPEIKAKWIAALRSGQFEQTTHHLHFANGYCCLGILCEISQRGEWKPFENVLNFIPTGTTTPADNAHLILPPELQAWAGLDASGKFEVPEGIKGRESFNAADRAIIQLSALNDSGFTFSQIADVIEYFF